MLKSYLKQDNIAPHTTLSSQMHRMEGFGPLPYMGISGTHTIMNRVTYFKMNYI